MLWVIVAIAASTLAISLLDFVIGSTDPWEALRTSTMVVVSFVLYDAFKERIQRDLREWIGITAVLGVLVVAAFLIGPKGVPEAIAFGVTVAFLLSLVDLLGVGLAHLRRHRSA